jgi:hypothetical protein
VAGLTQEEFNTFAKEIQAAWERATTRDDALRVITDFGRRHGYKNVIAAIQGRTPKRFDRETPLSDWIDERHREEAMES